MEERMSRTRSIAPDQLAEWAQGMVTAYPLYVVDADDRIVYWDARAEQELGVPAADALYRPCYEVLGALDPRNAGVCHRDCPVITLARSGRAGPDFSLWRRAGDGASVALRVSILLRTNEAGQATAIAHLVRGETSHAGYAADAEERSGANEGASPPCPTLTPRQVETLRLLAEGLPPPAIATMLQIRRVTVRNHIRAAMDRLDAHTRIEAIALARRYGLLPGVPR